MHAMHETQLILTDVHGVCQPVCHAAQLGFTVQKRLFGVNTLGAHETLCYMDVLIPLRMGTGTYF